MPYNENREQAIQYFEIGKSKLNAGYRNEALSNFNMAYAIASKNHLTDLKNLIQSYIDEF